jgi:hypothetical protein
MDTSTTVMLIVAVVTLVAVYWKSPAAASHGLNADGQRQPCRSIASLFKVGVGPLVTYLTAWSLFGLQRIIMWEIPFLGPKVVALRVAVIFFFPFLAGWLCETLWGKPRL